MSARDPYGVLREAQRWIASFAGACVGADEMVDRIADCLAARPASAAELAERHGFQPHDPPTSAESGDAGKGGEG